MITVTATQTTWLKDYPHASVGDCKDAIPFAKGQVLDVAYTLEANGHVYALSTNGNRDWIFSDHCREEGTEPGNDPQSEPEDVDELPHVPDPTPTFSVPGISATLQSSSPIWAGGRRTNFTWGEATKNGSRIPENSTITSNVIEVAGYMEGVREYLGDRPIGITSWYRDTKTNRAVGGASRSQHLKGNAVDFYVVGEDVVTTFSKMKKYIINDGGLAVGRGFIHLDLRGYASRWKYPGGPKVALW